MHRPPSLPPRAAALSTNRAGMPTTRPGTFAVSRELPYRGRAMHHPGQRGLVIEPGTDGGPAAIVSDVAGGSVTVVTQPDGAVHIQEILPSGAIGETIVVPVPVADDPEPVDAVMVSA